MVPRSTRQAMLAQLWTAEGIEAVLEVLSRAAVAREHEVIHELHAQAVECERTAPEVAAQLDRVAGQLAEVHAGLRAAESIHSLEELLRWQVQVPWRQSAAMQRLFAAVAVSTEPATWPWRLERLPILQAELDRLLALARELSGLPAAERRRGLESEPRLKGSELVVWLAARAGLSDAEAPAYARLHEHAVSWQSMRSVAVDEPVASGRPELAPLAELLELWYRLDPALDRTCEALVVEIVAGQRSLTDALRTVTAGADEPEAAVWRRACLLFHLLEDAAPAMRRAALVACTRLVASPEGQALVATSRGTLVMRWAVALELHWRVLPDPPAAFEGALRLVDHVRTALAQGAPPRLARDLLVVRTRLLRRLVGWRDALIEEAVQAHRRVLEAIDAWPSAGLRGRVLGELAGLRRASRGEDPIARDREIRALYEEALEELRDTVVMRARVLADHAVYLAQPLRPVDGDAKRALAQAEQAAALLEGLPAAAREHPLLRVEAAGHWLTLGNLRLEVGGGSLGDRQAVAVEDYRRALERLGESDEVLAGLVHLDLACVALAAPSHRRQEQRMRAHEELERAVKGLGPLPVPHARAIAERAMLAVRAAPDDELLRERSIREVEAALHGLPLGVDRVVRARVQRQLGELHLHRDGPDDLARAGECFVAARGAFVEGGAVRLAVEAARDYAEAQLRQHADDGDPAALTRAAVVLEQSALLAEQRWAARVPDESIEELTAMLDGVYGDLAWLLAKLERPAEVVLHKVTRAKRYRANPSLQALQTRAERSSMLSPAHIDPLARRSVPPPIVTRRAGSSGPSVKQLHARMLAFGAANPGVLALDLTLTRWGTVAVGVDAQGIAYTTVPLSRETVRRWVWGQPAVPGWWACYLAYRDALDGEREAEAATSEQAWVEAGRELSLDLGSRLLEPVAVGLGRSLAGRVLLLAPGRLSGLPFAAARIGGEALVANIKGLAQIASLAELPAGPLPNPRPGRALCVLSDAVPDAVATAGVDELRDVVRLLRSGQAEVEVLARVGDAVGEAAYRPAQPRARDRTVVSDTPPTPEAVMQRVPGIDHLFVGGRGWGEDTALLEVGRLAQGPRWAPASSVVLSAASRLAPPVDDALTWSLVRALHDAGVGLVLLTTCTVPPNLARELSRGLYLYWALGRSLVESFTAALANLAGSEPSRLGGFVLSLGASSGEPESA